ncbi:MAG: thioredoxin family protein [Deltaproteobacteria bacterium]|nr:thioredoxin family protein [Deltaproteobacteria bacterium]
MRRAILALAILVLALAGCGAQIPGWLPANITEAREAHKPLVLFFYATWCHSCRAFQADVLTDPRVVTALTRVKFVEYNGGTKAGLDALQRCRGRNVPLLVAIDGEGTIRLRGDGAERNAEAFLEFLGEAERVIGHH